MHLNDELHHSFTRPRGSILTTVEESALVAWLSVCGSAGMPLNGCLVRSLVEAAFEVAPSPSWFTRFRYRHADKVKFLSAKEVTYNRKTKVDMTTVCDWISRVEAFKEIIQVGYGTWMRSVST